jgi:amidase
MPTYPPSAWDDATDLAARVTNGDASPKELVDEAIARIETLNPALNAVIHERFERARTEAEGDLPGGPFKGVPILLKDIGCASAADPQHQGTRFLKDAAWVENHDSAATRRIREAGFVILGRTNTPEFGNAITTEPKAYGPARNPWNTEHSTGGSSGGSAAAVASGMVAVAHANDGGGSIRIPASECGLIGLKPSRGRVSFAPDGDEWCGLAATGVVTRTVRDTAALLDVMAGPEPGDPYAAVPLPGPLTAEVGREPGRLRIGLLDHPPLPNILADRECGEAVRAAGVLLEKLGHHVDTSHPAAMEDGEFPGKYAAVAGVNTATEVAVWERRLGYAVADQLEEGNRLLTFLGQSITGPQFAEVISWTHDYTRRMVSWWHDGWDLLVSPVLNGPPPKLGILPDPAAGGELTLSMWQYTQQFNVTGQPAISLPLGVSAAGLPIGVQFVAAPGREDLLVRLASQIEEAGPWQPWASGLPQMPAE